MHSHIMAAVTLSQYKTKKDSTRQQLSHCVRICVSSFFRLRERWFLHLATAKVTKVGLGHHTFLPRIFFPDNLSAVTAAYR